MLTIRGNPSGRFCDGVSRRDFIRIGGLVMGGIGLPQILRAEAQSGVRKSPKAIIMIYMAGAPPHQDLFDLKMDAPLEYRGPYQPISTNVPGIRISEHMPRCARIMDKLTPIRSLYGSLTGDHDSFICYTGRTARGGVKPPGDWPSIGATISKLLPPGAKEVPSFIGLAPNAHHPPKAGLILKHQPNVTPLDVIGSEEGCLHFREFFSTPPELRVCSWGGVCPGPPCANHGGPTAGTPPTV